MLLKFYIDTLKQLLKYFQSFLDYLLFHQKSQVVFLNLEELRILQRNIWDHQLFYILGSRMMGGGRPKGMAKGGAMGGVKKRSKGGSAGGLNAAIKRVKANK